MGPTRRELPAGRYDQRRAIRPIRASATASDDCGFWPVTSRPSVAAWLFPGRGCPTEKGWVTVNCKRINVYVKNRNPMVFAYVVVG